MDPGVLFHVWRELQGNLGLEDWWMESEGPKEDGRISYEKLRETHDRLKRIHDATNQAVGELHRQVDERNAQIGVLQQEVEAARKNVEQQKQIMVDALRQHAEEKAALEKEIRRLRG